MSPGVDEGRIAIGQRLGIEAQPLQRLRAHVGEEHVSRAEQPVQGLHSLVEFDVEGHRPLAPVGQGQRQVHAPTVAAYPLGHQAPVGIALRALDVDHVRTPVGQKGAGDRHEDPLGQLHHPHTVEGALTHRLLRLVHLV